MTKTREPLAGEIDALKAHVKSQTAVIAAATAEVEKLEGEWKEAGRVPEDALAADHREEFGRIVEARKAQGEARDEVIQAQTAILELTRPYVEPAAVNAATGKTPGEVFTSSEEYGAVTDWSANGTAARADVASREQTSVMLASADVTNLLEPQRLDRTVGLPDRQNRILNLIQVTPTTAPTVEYVVETLRRDLATEIGTATPGATGAGPPVTTATGVETPESEFEWDKATAQIQRIGHHYILPRSLMADIPRLETYVNVRGPKGIINRTEAQIYSGDGLGDNLTGILNTANILTSTRSGDTLADAVHKSMTLVAIANESEMPNGVVMNPADYEEYILEKAVGSGNYMNHSGAASAQRPTMWGAAVVSSTLATAQTVVVADFSQSELFVRSGIRVEAGYMERQLISDLITVNFETRLGFGVLRPSAFLALDLSV